MKIYLYLLIFRTLLVRMNTMCYVLLVFYCSIDTEIYNKSRYVWNVVILSPIGIRYLVKAFGKFGNLPGPQHHLHVFILPGPQHHLHVFMLRQLLPLH